MIKPKTESPKPSASAVAPPEQPPAPDAKPPEAAKQETPGVVELKAKADEFLASMFPVPGKKPAEKPKEEPPKAEAPPEPEKKEEPPAPPAPEKKPLPPPISEAVKPESLQAPPPPAPKKEPVEVDQFTDEDLETVAALARMEREGKAPAGIVERTKKFWGDEQAYIASWQKDNAGAQFDADSTEHTDWYEKNEPTYDDRAYKAAVKANLREELVAQAKAEVKKDTDADSYERQLREQAPKTAAVVQESIKAMVAEAGFKGLMTKDGKLVLTKEVEAEIDKASPHARAILLDEADVLGSLVSEIDKLEAFPGKYTLDVSKKQKLRNGITILPHDMLTDFAMGLESELASQAPENTMRDGKRFVTNSEFGTQVERIMQSKAPEPAKLKALDHLTANYYTLTLEDTRAALILHHTERAKARIGTVGGAKSEPAKSEPSKSDLPASAEFKTTPSGPAKAPSISSASDNVDTGRKAHVSVGKTTDDVVKAMW